MAFLWSLVLGVAGQASGQNTIRGRVLDTRGVPVANAEVLLHRITEQGGNSVAVDTSDVAGAFSLLAPPETDSSALYFVAIKQGGELYMGEMLRLPFPSDMEYIVEAGGAPVRLAPPADRQSQRAGIFVIVAGALAVGGVLFFTWRRRPPPHRQLLLELARLEEQMLAGNGDARKHLHEKRRSELYRRLKRNA